MNGTSIDTAKCRANAATPASCSAFIFGTRLHQVLTAPAATLFTPSGTINPGSAAITVPTPSHIPHAPTCVLNEKCCGVSFSKRYPVRAFAYAVVNPITSSAPSPPPTKNRISRSFHRSAVSMLSINLALTPSLTTKRSTTTSTT